MLRRRRSGLFLGMLRPVASPDFSKERGRGTGDATLRRRGKPTRRNKWCSRHHGDPKRSPVWVEVQVPTVGLLWRPGKMPSGGPGSKARGGSRVFTNLWPLQWNIKLATGMPLREVPHCSIEGASTVADPGPSRPQKKKRNGKEKPLYVIYLVVEKLWVPQSSTFCNILPAFSLVIMRKRVARAR